MRSFDFLIPRRNFIFGRQIKHSGWYPDYQLKLFLTKKGRFTEKVHEQVSLEGSAHKLKNELIHQIQNLLTNTKKQAISRIQVRIGDSILFLKTESIYFFQAKDKYIFAHTFDKSYPLTQSLNELETKLSSDDFQRIHRSVIININYIAEAYRWFSGKYIVKMLDKNKTELPVSR